MMKLPCKNCLILPICRAQCQQRFDYLDKEVIKYHPISPRRHGFLKISAIHHTLFDRCSLYVDFLKGERGDSYVDKISEFEPYMLD